MSVAQRASPDQEGAAELMEQLNSETAKLHA
jgi:hypothetical protein